MDYRKTYWFEQPHMPGMFNVAVQPIVDPRDGRLHFAVPDSGIWALTGKVIKDTGDYFEFECNDSVMGARGGINFLHWILRHSGKKPGSGSRRARTLLSAARIQQICISGTGRTGQTAAWQKLEPGRWKRTCEKDTARTLKIKNVHF